MQSLCPCWMDDVKEWLRRMGEKREQKDTHREADISRRTEELMVWQSGGRGCLERGKDRKEGGWKWRETSMGNRWDVNSFSDRKDKGSFRVTVRPLFHSLSLCFSLSLSLTHTLYFSLTHSLTHSQTHAYTLEQRQQIRVGARQQGKWYLYLHMYSWLMDWLNQPTHTHPAQSNTLIVGGQNTQVRTRVHTAFVQSEVNMGLVMGTFSMQSKPVNYHKGKTF